MARKPIDLPEPSVRLDGQLLTERMSPEQHRRVNPGYFRTLASIRDRIMRDEASKPQTTEPA